jgi:hypothetical protein
LDEARALVELIYVPSFNTVVRAGRTSNNEENPLHLFMVELPPAQVQELVATLNHLWPKPQRHKDYPVGVLQERTLGPDKKGHAAWKEAWARAIHNASQLRLPR